MTNNPNFKINQMYDKTNRNQESEKRSFQVSKGDWYCPNPGCNNLNFARRISCNRCHTSRPEDYQSLNGLRDTKSNGVKDKNTCKESSTHISASDWTCNTCGNINWERRKECNICKSLKPEITGLKEKRDGIGGGFNERQDRVASSKNEVGEDGYDDFGMMKKKQAKTSKREREAAALERLQQSYSAIIQPKEDVRTTTINTKSIDASERNTRKRRYSEEYNDSPHKSSRKRSHGVNRRDSIEYRTHSKR